jgi:hypothetical protein
LTKITGSGSSSQRYGSADPDPYRTKISVNPQQRFSSKSRDHPTRRIVVHHLHCLITILLVTVPLLLFLFRCPLILRSVAAPDPSGKVDSSIPIILFVIEVLSSKRRRRSNIHLLVMYAFTKTTNVKNLNRNAPKIQYGYK